MDTLRKVVAGLVALTACLIYAHASHAVAPVQKGQAPGYYRMMLGDFEIVALSDGTVALEVRKLLTNTFDTDPQAAAQRKKVYADGAKQKFWLAVAHLPFPGIGHIRADGQGYVYVPANYSVPR